MTPWSDARLSNLLAPYLQSTPLPPKLYEQVRVYLELLLHWNARTNLTALRRPEEILQRQIGESLFAAQFVPSGGSLLDFGSGAGFPGLPIQWMRPNVHVLLAESQGKKASFLREAARTLQLPCEVWAGRVEELPEERTFDVVAMRAVDSTSAMLPVASSRVARGGALLRFLAQGESATFADLVLTDEVSVPLSRGRLIRLQSE